MPFDSFMTAALTHELSEILTGIRVDRIFQPERDEIDLVFHRKGRDRLVINCTASTPYMALSEQARENPTTPPMMCMLLRKHLSRAKILSISQPNFDRTVMISFDTGDEMGFRKKKTLYCEMMGRGSNLVFADEDHKILAAFRQNDITTKFDRVVMVGMPYEPMPLQDKIPTLTCDRAAFLEAIHSCEGSLRADLFLQKRFVGFGKLTARELVFLAAGSPEAPLSEVDADAFWNAFLSLRRRVLENDYEPTLVYTSTEDYQKACAPFDFSFMPITHLTSPFCTRRCASVSEAIETYYQERNHTERQKQHQNDIQQILKTCKNRLEKKIAAQRNQLLDAADFEQDKKYADLIMQEIWRLSRGDTKAEVMDYTLSEPAIVSIPLDPMLSPAANAQRYYREYAKKKTALSKLEEQIRVAEDEKSYAESILQCLQNLTTAAEIAQIRDEISHWNYGRRLMPSVKKPKERMKKARPRMLTLPDGAILYVGMNNAQNDAVSTDLADPDDLWFHVKGYHGSHVLLKKGSAPILTDENQEYAASLAAYYSEVKDADKVEVDYTHARFLKKPNGSKPGFVTYKNHQTAIVMPRPIK